MIRRIIKINEELCNGCGACATACHEGAIEMINGKAKLMREDYCDGLGDCLPACPTNAISFEEREAPAYNEEAVQQAKAVTSQLSQWPVQIKLVPVNAPYFNNANLLIAADCTAYTYGNFHHEFIRNRITLIGCPKLDEGDYTESLPASLPTMISSVTIVRMEVPCCGGIENAAKELYRQAAPIPWQVVTIGTDGTIVRSY